MAPLRSLSIAAKSSVFARCLTRLTADGTSSATETVLAFRQRLPSPLLARLRVANLSIHPKHGEIAS